MNTDKHRYKKIITNEKTPLFLSPKNRCSFIRVHLCSSVAKKGFLFLALFAVISGCATAPQVVQKSSEEAQRDEILSQAASQFASPTAPKTLNLMDEAQAEWRSDKSMRITVHQFWAARVKPDHSLPPIASINQDSQNLNIQTLKLYEMDPTGKFVEASKQPEIQWVPPQD